MPELISVDYRALNARLHRENQAYGAGGARHAPFVVQLAQAIDAHTVLDYGCGKSALAQALRPALSCSIREYDPAIAERCEPPEPADLVVCTDVLEHVEPDKLPSVLADLRRCVRRVGYFVIHTGPSSKTLPDGRNCHLLQRPRQWWVQTLAGSFVVDHVWDRITKPIVHFLVHPSERPVGERGLDRVP